MARLRLILLASLAFVAFACARADATLCTIPNVFSNGTTINAAPFNANFSALQTCGNNIDNSNIGAAGILASQIIPTTVGQATFGGSQVYTFPAGVAAGGPVSGTTGSFSGAVAGTAISGTTGTFLNAVIAGGTAYVPPVYNASGAALNSGVHTSVIPTITTAGSTNTGCPPHGTYTTYYCGSFAFTGAAVFTSVGSSVGTTGNTMPSWSCGPPWMAASVFGAHTFVGSVIQSGYLVVDDTVANTVYFLYALNPGQVGPITCTGY